MERFAGTWLIREMSGWDRFYVNREVPGYFTFRTDRTGQFQFGLVKGSLFCHIEVMGEPKRFEFYWEGSDEMEPVSGTGWMELENGELIGEIFFNEGDETTFRATKQG